MRFRSISTAAKLGRKPAIVGVRYDLLALTIECEAEDGGGSFAIVFDGPRGFRCLDEGDLGGYWKHFTLKDGWLFEILEGGWMDLEAKMPGFISKALDFREYLIISDDDCISVLTKFDPVLVEADAV